MSLMSAVARLGAGLSLGLLGLFARASPPLAPVPAENSIGMKFVRIPAGEFEMGSDESADSLARDYPGYERVRFSALADEAPRHRVRITRAFELGQHEVTVGQFRRFLAQSGHVPESVADGSGAYGFDPAYDPALSERGDAFDGRDPKYAWDRTGFPQGEDHPVVNISWNDAVALAEWLSRREGRRYRLPTEAEWEYACRAGSRSRYHSGDAPASLSAAANVFDADSARHWPAWQARALARSDGHAFTSPVGRFAPNAWGLYDMHGNAWEWVSDWYGETYYAESPPDDPAGPPTGKVRVRRGGSWHTWALYARSAFRNWNTPETRYPLVGVRLLRELSSPP